MRYSGKIKKRMTKKEIDGLIGKVLAKDVPSLQLGEHQKLAKAGEEITKEMIDRIGAYGYREISYFENHNSYEKMQAHYQEEKEQQKTVGSSSAHSDAEKRERGQLQEQAIGLSLSTLPVAADSFPEKTANATAVLDDLKPITQEHTESWSKITVTLLDRQIHWLDQLAANIRLNTKAAISRAELIRAIIAAVEENGSDLSRLKSEEEIKKRLLSLYK